MPSFQNYIFRYFLRETTHWNKPEAAKILAISLPTFYAKIENYKLSKEKQILS